MGRGDHPGGGGALEGEVALAIGTDVDAADAGIGEGDEVVVAEVVYKTGEGLEKGGVKGEEGAVGFRAVRFFGEEHRLVV